MMYPIKRLTLAVVLGLVAALPARADSFMPVKEKDVFLSLVEGRSLRIPLYGLSLSVLPNGNVTGKALGWGIRGTWKWDDGYFCRELDWSGMEIPYNCQLVEASGQSRLRFTVDRGQGDSASFRLE
jgi:hypothetical protein